MAQVKEEVTPAFAQRFGEYKIEEVADGFHLNLSKLDIVDADLSLIGKFLQTHPQITSLDLSHNKIRNCAQGDLSTREFVHLLVPMVKPVTNVIKLDLNYNLIGDGVNVWRSTHLKAVFDDFFANVELVSLNLGNNPCGECVRPYLMHASTLVELDLSNTNLYIYCPILPQSLRKLNLSHNYIIALNKFASRVSPLRIKHHSTNDNNLTELDLSNNPIGDDAILDFMHCGKKFMLQKITLDNTRAGFIGHLAVKYSCLIIENIMTKINNTLETCSSPSLPAVISNLIWEYIDINGEQNWDQIYHADYDRLVNTPLLKAISQLQFERFNIIYATMFIGQVSLWQSIKPVEYKSMEEVISKVKAQPESITANALSFLNSSHPSTATFLALTMPNVRTDKKRQYMSIAQSVRILAQNPPFWQFWNREKLHTEVQKYCAQRSTLKPDETRMTQKLNQLKLFDAPTASNTALAAAQEEWLKRNDCAVSIQGEATCTTAIRDK